MSWKKEQLGHDIKCCGWTFSLKGETIHLSQSKLAKLRDQLRALRNSRKVPRKLFEATLGLLMWATSTRQHLRPYMAPLYRDLRSVVGTLKLIHPPLWQHFLGALNDSAKVARQPVGLWLPIKAQVIRAGSHEVQSKGDLPKVVSAQKGMRVRIADPQRSEVHLRQESKEALQWLFACFAHDRQRPLRQKPMLHCFAAADARADGDTVGVGGWIVTSMQCAWFAEQWQVSELRTVWPQLSDSPRRYIACCETLAQLALAMTAHPALKAKQWAFCLPAASDNTAAEAKTEKLWSTAEPLGTFLKLSAAWATQHHVELLVTHLAGELNRAQQRETGSFPASHGRKSFHWSSPISGCIRLHHTAPARSSLVRTFDGSATAATQGTVTKIQRLCIKHRFATHARIADALFLYLQVHRIPLKRGALQHRAVRTSRGGTGCLV